MSLIAPINYRPVGAEQASKVATVVANCPGCWRKDAEEYLKRANGDVGGACAEWTRDPRWGRAAAYTSWSQSLDASE